MKAIIELQKRAMDSSTDIVELVRYAYAIAKKLDLQDFVDWCNAELNGYTDNIKKELPEYRWLQGELMCYHNCEEKPFEIEGLSSDVKMKMSGRWYTKSLLELKVAFDKSSPDRLRIKLPSDLEQRIKGLYNKVSTKEQNDIISSFGISPNLVNSKMLQNCIPEIDLFISIPIDNFTRICNKIRNEILTWTLDCEKKGILGEEWIFTNQEKEMAQNITNNYSIGSVQNMANHNTDTTINQTTQNMSVTKGDFQSLANFLSDKGINAHEIQELKEIIDVEPNLATEGMGNNKVQGWVGKIATKMATGTMAVTKGVTVEVIVKALEQFF